MKSIIKYSLPDWLFKPSKSFQSSSTTVSAFSPEEAIKTQKGFQGRMLPGPESAQPEKMTLLINAPSLKYEKQAFAIDTAMTISSLIRDGFKIYIIHHKEPLLLESTQYLTDGDQLDHETAATMLVTKTNIPRDDIVICNYGKIEALRERLIKNACAIPSQNTGNLIIDQWKDSQTLPMEQDFSCISIDKDDIKSLGLEFKKALAINHLNATELEISNRQHNNFPSEMNGIKTLTLKGNYSIDMLRKSQQLETLIMSGLTLSIKHIHDIITSTPTLKCLELAYNVTLLHDKDIGYYQSIQHLEKLIINCKGITQNIFKNILLNSENIQHIFISPAGVGEFEFDINIPGLKTLKASHIQLTRITFKKNTLRHVLNALHQPIIIELDTCNFLNDATTELNSQHLKSVKKFHFEAKHHLHTALGILKEMEMLEELHISDHSPESCFSINTATTRFPKLKTFKLYNTQFDQKSIQHIYESSTLLKKIDLSDSFGNELNKNRIKTLITSPHQIFATLQELRLSYLTLQSSGLKNMISKMPRLLMLELIHCVIKGDIDITLEKNPLKHIKLYESTISKSVIRFLLYHSHLIELTIEKTICEETNLPFSEIQEDITRHMGKQCLLSLSMSHLNNETLMSLMDGALNLRLILNTDSEDVALDSCARVLNSQIFNKLEHLHLSYKIQSRVIIEFLKAAPNIEYLSVDEKSINSKLMNFIMTSQLKNKQAIYDDLFNKIESTDFNARIAPPQDTVRGNKIKGAVYDVLTVFSKTEGDLNPPDGTPSFKLSPLFMHESGPDLQLDNIRLWAYSPDFTSNPHAVVKRPIVCVLDPYTIPDTFTMNDSIYRHPTYDTAFNEPIPALGLIKPWIRLRGLTANDRLTGLKINLEPSQYDQYFCKSDRFFYLLLKEGVSSPPKVTLSYKISPYKPSCIFLPKSIQKKRKRLDKIYMSPPPPGFATKNLKDKLQDILHHPEHHACNVRADAFLSSISDSNEIDNSICAGSGLHGWAEVVHNDIWYTVDLGGAPVKLKYLPVRTHASDLSMRTFSAPSQLPAPDINKTLPLLNKYMNEQDENTNILLICKKDDNQNHIKSVRRYIRSLAPDTTIVIDNYHQALSSSRYIQLNTETESWAPKKPTHAEGWLAKLIAKGSQHRQRILLDWSAFTDNQTTKMNACIDLSHRQIDGVPLDKSIVMIGLIYEGDHRLEDTSFMSRHSGKIINFTDYKNQPDPTHPQQDNSMSVVHSVRMELYHSTQWQQLILGQLIFDKYGNPIFAGLEPFHTTESIHLIINNPPRNCEAFERFIHDIEDGRNVKYCDQSIPRPRMKVTLTHVMDFEKLNKATNTLRTGITREMLASIAIDHVLTPSTFEHCDQTRTIKNSKIITSPGWLTQATAENPLSFYITNTLSEEQWSFLGNAKENSLILNCAPGVVLPKELHSRTSNSQLLEPLTAPTQAPEQPVDLNNAIIIDVSELSPDDILYRHDYDHDIKHNRFIFKENISDVWTKLHAGSTIMLTGTFSDEMLDHLATLLIPNPYLWHDGEKKPFKGRLILDSTLSLSLHGSAIPPKEIFAENERKRELLELLKFHPAVFIEGHPGTGKSCFIRQLKSDPNLDCVSFDAIDLAPLTKWAESKEDKPHLLLIDEATIRGTDWSMFTALYTHRKDFLIQGKLYQLSKRHQVVFIGNQVKNMPALLNEHMPKLVFKPLTRQYVIDNILQPIFAEKLHDQAAFDAANQHYDDKKTVREMHGQAIAACSKDRTLIEKHVSTNSERQKYFITHQRQPILDAIISSLKARRFMQEAQTDSAKYGGQTGHMLEGLPRIGKTNIIHAAMKSAHYDEIVDLNKLYEPDHDHRFCYYCIPASCDIDLLRQHLKQTFDQGCIVHIDELDSLMKPDTPEKEDDVKRLIAELNAYLMGEDLQHSRPTKPGFMLLATGNGISFYGRAPLQESLVSRLHKHAVQPYCKEECQSIIASRFPNLNADLYINKFVQNPKVYTFSDLLADCEKSSATRFPVLSTYSSAQEQNSRKRTVDEVYALPGNDSPASRGPPKRLQ